ncbi:hypothetical protein [Dactylosporangium darangshiense]|uniref:hypothetical protein n=1 Tax=Dactylosporangium darangshiense TaxID=579108 RepID=UPI00363F0A90
MQAVYDWFREHDRWPLFQDIDRALRTPRGADPLQIIREIEPELLRTSASRGMWVDAEHRIWLTVVGVAECAGSDVDVATFLRALRWMALYEAKTAPPPGQMTVLVSRANLTKALRLNRRAAARLFHLLDGEQWGSRSRSGDADADWSFGVNRDVRWFSRVHTVDEFRAAGAAWAESLRPAPPAEPAQVFEPAAAAPLSLTIDERVLDRLATATTATWDFSKLAALARSSTARPGPGTCTQHLHSFERSSITCRRCSPAPPSRRSSITTGGERRTAGT